MTGLVARLLVGAAFEASASMRPTFAQRLALGSFYCHVVAIYREDM